MASHISISPCEVKVKKLISLAAVAAASALLVAFSTQEPPEEPPDEPAPAYVGARKCKVCHLDTYKSWEKTGHARALSALKDKNLKDPGCLACHTTGLGKGGYGAEGGVVDLGGVQCEACHGPGSLYSRSSVMRKPELHRTMGLVKIDSTTCITCHNDKSPAFKDFAYEAGLLTGTHSRRRNKPD